MPKTEVRSGQIKDSTVGRSDHNVATPGEAVVVKIVPGPGITLSSTGADVGTGDVTISASGGGGGGSGNDEVFIGPDDPGETFELWYDTDEPTVAGPPHGITHELGGSDPVRIGKMILAGTLAQQPTGLGPADAGLLYQVLAPYNHTVRWSGTVWEFAPGDCGNGYLADRVIAPQEAGWALCDGAATDYLKVGGATLTAQAFTTPVMLGAFRKGASTYTGAVIAASGATTSAATGTTNLDGPTVTVLGGPTATGAADRALYANLDGPTATVGADRSLLATSSANPEGWSSSEGHHSHTGWVDGVGDHSHWTSAWSTDGAGGNRGTDAGSSFNSSDAHSHGIPGRWTDAGGAHSHGMGTNATGAHSHWRPAHSHTVLGIDHLHGIAQHTHTVTDHLHGVAQHTHGIAQHTHGLGGHTHTVGASEPTYVGVPVYFRR